MCINYSMVLPNTKFTCDQTAAVSKDGTLPIEIKFLGIPGKSNATNVVDSSNVAEDSLDYCDVTAITARYVACDKDGNFLAPFRYVTTNVDFNSADFNGRNGANGRHGAAYVHVPFDALGLMNDSLQKIYLEFTLNNETSATVGSGASAVTTVTSTTDILQSNELFIMGNAFVAPTVLDNKTPVNFSAYGWVTTDTTRAPRLVEYVELSVDWGIYSLGTKMITLIDTTNSVTGGPSAKGRSYTMTNTMSGVQKILLVPDGYSVNTEVNTIVQNVSLTAGTEYMIVIESVTKGLVTSYSQSCPNFTYFSGNPTAPSIVAIDTANKKVYVTPGTNAEELEFYTTEDYKNGLPLASFLVETNGVKYDVASGILVGVNTANIKGPLQDSILNNYPVDLPLTLIGDGVAFNTQTNVVQKNVTTAELSATLISLKGSYEVPILGTSVDLVNVVNNRASMTITIQQVHKNLKLDQTEDYVYSPVSNSVTVDLSELAAVTSLTASQDFSEEGTTLTNDIRVVAQVKNGTSSVNNLVVKLAPKKTIDNIVYGASAVYVSGLVTTPATKPRSIPLAASDYPKLLVKDTDYTVESSPSYNVNTPNVPVIHTVKIKGDKLKEYGYHTEEPVEAAVYIVDGATKSKPFDRSANSVPFYANRSSEFGSGSSIAIGFDPTNALNIKLVAPLLSYGTGVESSHAINLRLEQYDDAKQALAASADTMSRLVQTAGAARTNQLNLINSLNLTAHNIIIKPSPLLTDLVESDKTNFQQKHAALSSNLDDLVTLETKKFDTARRLENQHDVSTNVAFLSYTPNNANDTTLESNADIVNLPVTYEDMDKMLSSTGFTPPISYLAGKNVRIRLDTTSKSRNMNDPTGYRFNSSTLSSTPVNVKTTFGAVSNVGVNQTTDGSISFSFEQKIPATGYTVALCKNASILPADNKTFTIIDNGSNFNSNTAKLIYNVIIKSVALVSAVPAVNPVQSFNQVTNIITYTYYAVTFFTIGDYMSIDIVPTISNSAAYTIVPYNLTVIASSKISVGVPVVSNPEATDPFMYDEIFTFTVTPNGQVLTKALFLPVFGDDLMDPNDYGTVADANFGNIAPTQFSLDKALNTYEFYITPELATVINGKSITQFDYEKNHKTNIFETPVYTSKLIRSMSYESAATSSNVVAITDIAKLIIRFATHDAKVTDCEAKKKSGEFASSKTPADSAAGVQGLFAVFVGEQNTSKPSATWKVYSKV